MNHDPERPLVDEARLECRICWYRYDPAVGDPVAQIPPGTPFSALPSHWRCPQCDAGKEMFLLQASVAGEGGA